MKKLLVLIAGLSFAAILGTAMFALESTPVDLRLEVSANLPLSGVDHEVTAVLLNYRGYDTLLEIAVLLLALLGILAVMPFDRTIAPPADDPVLPILARLAIPLMVIVALYLLWAGAFKPGGAFQAGAVLGAAGVLAHLTGLVPGWHRPRLWLRSGLAAGFAVFLCVATATLGHGAFLEYPRPLAGALILLIEATLTLSLGFCLSGLFLLLSKGEGDKS
ncbi:MAG: MnhB domain-containing protein [Porticoccaceae bacterium]|jgi:multisubunit Na+/H+ antiporter MnhB subunit